MTRLKVALAACALAFAAIPALPATAHACAEVQCYVNCVRGALQGNLICAA
ncbi:MAG: hypothetical protein M3279_00710 [Actinomycetota bacterium]|nr:hypothetical protein [Actinomycetota bacterium]